MTHFHFVTLGLGLLLFLCFISTGFEPGSPYCSAQLTGGSEDDNSTENIVKVILHRGDPDFFPREYWEAKPPKEQDKIPHLPVPYVVIHHTYEPGFCNTTSSCSGAMRAMQHMHQDLRGWWDIGYNFCIGGTGGIFQGRGWDVVGAHAPRYNNRSVGICFIGNFMEELPTKVMLASAKFLIQQGVKKGSIAKDYKLVGHRQVRQTECPGNRLFQEIKTWEHWDPIQEVKERVVTITPPIIATSVPPTTTTSPAVSEVSAASPS